MTNPFLDVVEILLQAFNEDGRELHGWAIMKAAARSGPTVYGVLDRLEDSGWIVGRWEQQEPAHNRPRRRLYQLTPTGAVSARELLASRRPDRRRTQPGLTPGARLRPLLSPDAR